MLNYNLETKYSESQSNVPLSQYPRPQLVRDSYINLNGKWDFCKNLTGDVPKTFDKTIIVPYPVESALSGANTKVKDGEYLIYHRIFSLAKEFIKDKTLLHFDASDAKLWVFVNNTYVGNHEGGYLPAIFDISKYIKDGENEIVAKVIDNTNCDYPIGKQRKKRGGIWYTPISGIWQSVWLESVSNDYIADIKLTPNLAKNSIKVEIDSECDSEIKYEVFAEKSRIFSITTNEHSVNIPINDIRLWSPESPFLYDIVIKTSADEVRSYFGMRELKVVDKQFFLNGKPYFINGLLDQGYFSDGIYTPADYMAFYDDILTMKKLGFNALRKHIKIEPLIYYNYCDRLGMLVLQDMVNVGKYSFIKDSLLPFSNLVKKLPYINTTKTQQQNFIKHSIDTVKYLYNLPSVVYYTIFNEGWGQFDGDGLYKILNNIDNTRIYDATSGWYKENLSDVLSLHIYFRPIKLPKSDKPIIVSEFGGYSISLENHVFNTDKTFGYKKFCDLKDYEEAFFKLYETEIIANIKNGLAGAIYTQLSDVEDETNGILTYDRKVCKLDNKKTASLMERLYAVFNDYNKV